MTAAPASTSPQTLVRLRAAGWPRPERAASMPDGRDGATTITVTDRCLSRDEVPWIPVTGEMHYSRVPRGRWAETLRLMKAGGITVVATYLPWIHHQPERGTAPRFDDGLDVAELVRLAAAEGLDVVLRVGPWCHGEVRNGGLPDWVVAAPYTERTDDPAYLEDVRTWFGHLGDQLRDWCEPGGPVVGVQVENEIYDQPGHISTLKEIAREVGIRAPLWTATAWGGADIPVGDVFPMYGGYQDGFWLDTHDRWEDHGFAGQFSFSDQWDAPEIGADLAGDSRTAPLHDASVPRESADAAPRPEFPPATCELGGGMASAYHRRIDAQGRDTAAIAHCKAGSGSAWQGYYMYAGGTNPGPDLQESHATGYPNDLPELNYDFRAPVGAHLQLRESFHRLRGQHAFLAAYGSRLAQMPSTAGSSPAQWALRSDGRSGFLYLSTHRPYTPLPGLDGMRFEVDLAEQTVRVPHVPVDVPSGATAAWPLMLDLGETMLRWATATVLTRLDTPQGEPLLVLTAAPGVPVHLAFPADHEVTVERTGAESAGAGGPAAVLVDGDAGERVLTDVVPSATTVVRVDGPQGRAHILVLSEEDALRAWTPTVDGRLRLVLTDAEAVYETSGRETAAGLQVLTSGPASVDVLGTDTGAGYERHDVAHDVVEPRITVELVRAAREPAPTVVTVPDRASAPTASDVEERSARYRVTVTGLARAGERSLLRLDLVGDVARSTFDGRAEDLFWNGAEWDVDITPTTDVEERVVDVLIYPIVDDTPVRLPERAEHARSRVTGPTAEIQSAEVLTFRTTTLTLP